MNSAPTADLVLLLMLAGMPATNAAPLDDAAEREAKLFGASRIGSRRSSLEAASR
jgi:hypothetical protein